METEELGLLLELLEQREKNYFPGEEEEDPDITNLIYFLCTD